MTKYTVRAEFHELSSVRVHEPGFETFAGVVDPEPNLFRSGFAVERAQSEHRDVVEILENEGVDVHYLHEDIDENEFESLMNNVEVDLSGIEDWRQESVKQQINTQIKSLETSEKLQLVASNATIIRDGKKEPEDTDSTNNIEPARFDKSSLHFTEPLSNLYFQRDQQIVTAEGPVIGSPAFSTRAGETDIARAAWRGIDGSIVEEVPQSLRLEGGDYIPCGEFALLGVSANIGQKEKVLRTSTEAAKYLLENNAFDHRVVGLVEAPYQADQIQHQKHKQNAETPMEIMHLDTWFNIAAEGLAVARQPLVDNTTIHLYTSGDSGYEKNKEMNFGKFLRSRGYSIIPVEYDERAVATNFLTLEDGKVLAARLTDKNGEQSTNNNKTIDRMRNAGIEIVPNGEGIPISALRSGYGGIHCMTTPLNRTS